MRIRATHALVTAALAPVIAAAGCSSAHPTASTSTAPAQSGTSPTTASASPASASFTMPNEVGRGLQDAQDDLQRVSGNPVYISRSHDLLGTRHQILDRDWKVCTQNIAEGATVSKSDTVDFGVVKLSESCP
jgi:hypothetical protein